MPARFERYRMTDGRTPLGERYFNAIWRDIDLRIATLEEVKIAWSAAVDEVVKFGLVRIDELINEPLQSVLALSSQAQSTSANLEQLRLLAESRTADLTELITTLKADTAAQVAQFIATANGDIAAHKAAVLADLTEWKVARTIELEAWVAAYEARLQAARAEIDAAIAALQASVADLARLRRVRRDGNFAPVAADTRTCFVVTAAATITVPAAATLGAGWWCEIINDSGVVVNIAGAVALELRPGARARLHADAAAVEVLDLTASLERSPLWGLHYGRRYVGMGLALRREMELPMATSTLVSLEEVGVLLGLSSSNNNYWSTTDGESLVARSFPAQVNKTAHNFAWTGARFLAGVSSSTAGQYIVSTDAANWTVATLAGAAASIKTFASNGNGRVVASANSGNTVYWSQDHGENWTAAATVWPFSILTFFNGLFIGLYNGGYVYTSPTGQTWTSRGTVGGNLYACKKARMANGQAALVFTGAAGAKLGWTVDGVTFGTMDGNTAFGGFGDVVLSGDGMAGRGLGATDGMPISFPINGWAPTLIETFGGRVLGLKNNESRMLVSTAEDFGFFEREVA